MLLDRKDNACLTHANVIEEITIIVVYLLMHSTYAD